MNILVDSSVWVAHFKQRNELNTHQLFGRGCGFVDISLIASALISEKILIWTFDKRLEQIARELSRAYAPRLNV